MGMEGKVLQGIVGQKQTHEKRFTVHASGGGALSLRKGMVDGLLAAQWLVLMTIIGRRMISQKRTGGPPIRWHQSVIQDVWFVCAYILWV